MRSLITTKAAAALLSQLVACPSVNPGRRAARLPSPDGQVAGPTCGEGALADLLERLVTPWGAAARKVEFAPGRFNFIAEFPGATSRRLLLEAHADTVPPDDAMADPFTPVVRGGRLYGRGSCDNKAAMAAMLLAIRAVLQGGARPRASVLFVATGDEELGARGAHRLVADGLRADAAIVGEPTGLAVVHAHKGVYRFRLTACGRAAHSSVPARGASAIAAMARVVQAIEGPLARRLARRRNPILGAPTVSVGVIRGGTQVNIVPARCEIEVDRRTLPGERREDVLGEFRHQIARLRRTGPRVRYEFEELQWYPAFEEDRDGPLALLVRAAAARVLGRARVEGVPWTANAGVLRQAGIPCILFGPGSIRQAHAAEEYVALREVVRAAEVYAEILRRF